MEEENTYLDKYRPDSENRARDLRILVLGMGGGGSNAVNHMYRQNPEGIEFVVLNTDAQALRMSPVPTKLLIGPNTTGGFGAGGKPEIAREAAEESIEEIEALLEPRPNMVFITAGIGGGTGTGASPVVARAVKSRGILTVGIVTIPFFFEGMPKIRKALRGADELGKYTDALLVINNERLTEIYPKLGFTQAFAKADDILTTAASSISEIVTTPSMINLDMRDVDSTLRDGATALISVGYGEGENRMTQAIQNALHSPLLRDSDVYSAKRLLFAFYFSPDIDPPYTAEESNEITQFIRDMNLEVEVIWGYGLDDSLGNQVKFTLLASGFDITVSDTPREGRQTIEGAQAPVVEDDPEMRRRMAEMYGNEKVEEVIRKQETQNYIILDADQLDNDDVIDMIERTPAYQRDKRVASSVRTGVQYQAATRADNNRNDNKKTNSISFSPDDL